MTQFVKITGSQPYNKEYLYSTNTGISYVGKKYDYKENKLYVLETSSVIFEDGYRRIIKIKPKS